MTGFLIYLLEASLCLSLFYAIYLLLIRNDTFYRLKRFYLLATIILSLIMPELPATEISQKIALNVAPSKTVLQKEEISQDVFGRVVIGSITSISASAYPARKSTVFMSLLFLLYVFGAGFMLYRTIRVLSCIFNLIGNHEHRPYDGFTVISLHGDIPTFSFLGYIFMNQWDANHEDARDILMHEECHIRQGHTFDIMFLEIFKVLFWFNPVIWQYKKILLQVHECLADDFVVQAKSGNADSYKSLLLSQYLSNVHIKIAHAFSYLSLQYRIKMLARQKSKGRARYKLLIAIPFMLLAFVVFSNYDLESIYTLYSQTSILPRGWGLPYINNDYKIGIDKWNSQNGQKSVFIEAVKKNPKDPLVLMQTRSMLDFRGKRVKMTGYIKVQDSVEFVSLWLRVDDMEKQISGEFDNMLDRQAIDALDWKKLEIVFDVPDSRCLINYGLLFQGEGKAWFDNLSFEIVEPSLAKTTWNLDFPLPVEYIELIEQDWQRWLLRKLSYNLDFEH